MLYCLVLGDIIEKSFTVEVSRDLSVSVLRKTIWEEKKNFFNENKIDADQLKLWRVNIPVDGLDLETKINAEDIKEQLVNENKLSTFKVVENYFDDEEAFLINNPIIMSSVSSYNPIMVSVFMMLISCFCLFLFISILM